MNPPIQDAAITIIGAGIIGLCAAYELASAGADVLLVERDDPNQAASGNNAGSLHVQLLGYAFAGLDSSDAIAMRPMLPLAREATLRWQALETTLGADLEIRRNGGFSIAHTQDQVRRLQRKTAIEREAGLDVHLLSGPEARRLAPALAPTILAASFSPDEGQLNPLRAGPALLAATRRAGLRVLTRTEVTALLSERSGYRVVTPQASWHTGQVLNAAGAWAAQIAAMVGIALPIRPTPLQMLVTEPLAPILDQLVAHVRDHLTLKQARSGNILIGGGWPARWDSQAARALPTIANLAGNASAAIAAIPALAQARVIRSWAAMNVSTVGPPLISATPSHPNLVHAATSNGLTYAPIVGRICADLLLHRRPEFDTTLFALGGTKLASSSPPQTKAAP